MDILDGDSRFFWAENIGQFAALPSTWDSILNTGMGIPSSSTMWITSYLNFTAFFSHFGLSWQMITIIFWLIPPIVISFLGSYHLFRHQFPQEKSFALISGFIYVLNSYFLMLISGGQLGISLAYSLAPYVLLFSFKLFNKPDFRGALIAGLISSFQILFDPRFFMISFFGVIIYLSFYLNNKITKKILFFIFNFLVIFLLHFFWLFPLISSKGTGSLSDASTLSSFRFFSFASFENAFALLHPNWPENIFGKVVFFKPEFLIIPLIAYFSLFFIQITKNINLYSKRVLIFALIALIGIFLAKGSNPPFGFINEFLYSHFPPMKLFRDTSKFYILISLSYSMLIPYTLYNLSKSNKYSRVAKLTTNKKIISSIFLILWVAIISLSSQLIFIKKFIPKNIPQDYIVFKDLLVKEEKFSRTLWIPKLSRYRYLSSLHPSVDAAELLGKNDLNSIKKFISKPHIKSYLQDRSIGYIVIPIDTQGDIFSRQSRNERKEFIALMSSVFWLKKDSNFKNLGVYKIENSRDHFWSKNKNMKIEYQQINQTKYLLNLKNVSLNDQLIFSENHNPNWVAVIEDNNKKIEISSTKYSQNLNSFHLPKGEYKLQIIFRSQDNFNLGIIVSSLSLLTLLIIIFTKK